jgi:hypothetical protein
MFLLLVGLSNNKGEQDEDWPVAKLLDKRRSLTGSVLEGARTELQTNRRTAWKGRLVRPQKDQSGCAGAVQSIVQGLVQEECGAQESKVKRKLQGPLPACAQSVSPVENKQPRLKEGATSEASSEGSGDLHTGSR